MVELETLSHALGIDDKRNKKLEWYVDEIMNTGCLKSDAIKKIVAVEATEDEKVYMGYLLAKFIVKRTTPDQLFNLICKLTSI